MPQVPYWETSDGCLFKAQKEHDEHESWLADIATVNKYLDEQEWPKPAQRTKAFNAIMAFLDWKNRDSNVVPIAKAGMTVIGDATEISRLMEAQVNMNVQIAELKREQDRLRREVETLLRIIDRQQGTINRLHDDKTVRIKTDRD